jgi:hypothetical protein
MAVAKTSSIEQHNFFVTGLPRTRTAWFSEWLPNCLHEGIEGCSTHKEFVDKVGNKGDSDSGLMFFPIESYFPHSPVVIVERDFDDVINSLSDIYLMNNDIYEYMRKSQKKLDKMKGMRVPFDDLPLNDIWDYLIGTEFDKREANKMNDTNIQHINYTPDFRAFMNFIGEV